MTIRIGANPIGWSNDDMLELGGETPLEVCLAEAKEAGFEGMELGNKFPREPEALKKALAPFGLACVSGWYSAELLTRSAEEEIEGAAAASRPPQGAWARTCSSSPRPRTPFMATASKPLSQRPVMKAGDWAEFGRRVTQVAEHTLNEGVRLVYHHHMGTIVQSERRHRRLHERDRRSRASPPRHRPCDLGRRRSGGARAALSCAHQPRAHQGRAQGRDGALAGGGLELPRFGSSKASTRCRATGWWTSSRCSASCRAIAAGSSSRPSRIPRRRTRSPMPRWAMPTSRAS